MGMCVPLSRKELSHFVKSFFTDEFWCHNYKMYFPKGNSEPDPSEPEES